MVQDWELTLSGIARKMEEEAREGRLQHITNGLKRPCTPQNLGKRLEQLTPIIMRLIEKMGSVGNELQRNYTMKMNSEEKPKLNIPRIVDGSIYMKSEKQWKDGINFGEQRRGVKTIIVCTGTLPSVMRTFYFSKKAPDQAEIRNIQQLFSHKHMTTGDSAFLSREMMEYADQQGTYYLIRIHQGFNQKKLHTAIRRTSYGLVEEEIIRIGKEEDPTSQWIVRKIAYIKQNENKVKYYEWVTNNWKVTGEEIREIAERHWIIEQVHQQIQETFHLHETRLRKKERVEGFMALGHLLGQMYTLFFLRTQKEGEPFIFPTVHKQIQGLWKKRVETRAKTYEKRFPEKAKHQQRRIRNKERKKREKKRERRKKEIQTGRLSARGQDRLYPPLKAWYNKEKSALFYEIREGEEIVLRPGKKALERLKTKKDTNALRIWMTLAGLYPKKVTRKTLCKLTLLPRTTAYDAAKRLEKENIVHIIRETTNNKRGRPRTFFSLHNPNPKMRDTTLNPLNTSKPPPN